MKVAIPVWGSSVSTVFDFADRLLLVDVEAGQIKKRSEIEFFENTIIGKAARLRELGVHTLLSGAISRPLENMVIASGINIIPFVRGTVDEVLEAYLAGHLMYPRFSLPGYYPGRRFGRGGRQRRRGGRHIR